MSAQSPCPALYNENVQPFLQSTTQSDLVIILIYVPIIARMN